MSEGMEGVPGEVVDIAAERQKRADGNKPLGAPVVENAGKPDVPPIIAQSARPDQDRSNVIELNDTRQRLDDEWKFNLLRNRMRAERADPRLIDEEWNLNGDEWKHLQKADPLISKNIQWSNRLRLLEKEAGGDRNRFDQLVRQEAGKKREEEEIKNRKVPTDHLTREELAKRRTEIGLDLLTDKEWQERERMKSVDPATLSKEQWEKWKRSSASTTVEDLQEMKEFDKVWQEHLNKERQKREALGWSGDLGDLGDGHYVDVIVECAEKAGVDPRTLTPGQRKELRTYHRFLTDEERKMNPRERYAKVYNIPLENLPKNVVDGTGQEPREQSAQNLFDTIRETWEKDRRSPEQDFIAFQQWFWSLPLDVVVGLWEKGPQSMRPELEPPTLLETISALFRMLRNGVKAVVAKSRTKETP